MKLNKKYNILFIVLLATNLIFTAMSSSKNTVSTSFSDIADISFETNGLGEEVHSYETFVGLYEFDYHDGLIYGVMSGLSYIYVLDATTGESVSNISIPHWSEGITTDGTYLYVSLYDLTPPNGTIIKYDFSGNEISRINIPLNSDFIHGLTWDGSHLWAHKESPNCLLRIDPDTGIITKNITLDFTPHGLTYYRNRIWADAYVMQRVIAINPNTGEKTDYFDSAYFLDSGVACNETHFMQSNYLDSMEPFAIAFFELPQEPGDVFTKSSQLFTNVLDITYKKDYVYFAENSSTYIYGISDSEGGGFISWSTNSFEPVGMTLINDNYFLMSSLDAPYNLYTFTIDGTLVMNQTTEVSVMIRSLEFDGTYVWAMGIDGILYKLDPVDMSIIDQFTLTNRIFSIAYDYDLDVLWAVDKSDHTIKYINTTTGEYGENTFDILAPISTYEYGLAYDGEFLLIATSYSGGYYFKILKGELDPPDEPPTTTPPPSTTPTTSGPDGLFPSLPYYVEDLIFFGIGAVLVGLIFGIIAIVRRSKGR